MKIAVFGANGRVGSAIVRLAEERKHDVIKIEKGDIPAESADVAIDFSAPQATRDVCEYCRQYRCPLVTGVTGRNDEERQFLENLKDFVRVEEKSNFSRGIAAMHKVCKLLSALKWDCEIVETHRKGKKDCPSGTAKDLAATVASGGETRIVKIHALRCGSNFGKHTVVFASDGESITVTHQAENVEIFARGALDSAEKLASENRK